MKIFPLMMYSHVEYFNYSLHALRTITLYSARVYSCVYKTMCYFERRYATDALLRGRLWRPGVARPTHMVRSRLVYIITVNAWKYCKHEKINMN
jgi:hypothetical protein